MNIRMAETSGMDWKATSFLALGPDDEVAAESARPEMFSSSAPKNLTASQAKASAHAKIMAESNTALAELKSGVKISQFMPILRKVYEFRENKDDPEVAKFMTNLGETCEKVAETEKDVLFLTEAVN